MALEKHLWAGDAEGRFSTDRRHHHAAREGCLDCLEMLIDAGIPLDVTDSSGRTPLHHACSGGQTRVVLELLRTDAVIVHIDDQDSHGWTPLHRAAMEGDTDSVRALLDAGASTSLRDVGKSWTPLDWAVANGHGQVIELLQATGIP